MRRVSMVLAFVVIAGILAFRIVNWGADVKDVVDAEHQKQLVQFSNSVVDPLNAAAKSVDAMHALLRRASDPTAEKHKGLVALLEISGDTVPDSIANARKSVQALELPSSDEVRELLDEANALLNVYEGFVPVHADLAKKILASSDLPPELTSEVDQRLADLESQKNESIKAFTRAQQKFLR